MKREGRQRGMVKAHPIEPDPWNPQPSLPSRGELGPAPTAGQFTKVSTKPTNHSKITGKSKDKAKGAQRLRASSGVASDYSVREPGFSATSVMENSDSDDCMDRCYGDDHDEKQNDSTRVQESDNEISYPLVLIEEVVKCEAKTNGIDGVDNEDETSFCDVGLFWQVVNGDED